MNKYRTQNGSLYQYSALHNAYIHVMKLNGRSKKQAIKDLEQSPWLQ